MRLQIVYLRKRITDFIIFLLICIVSYSNAYADLVNIAQLNHYVPTSISSLIRNTELKYRIPRGLLASIAKVESGNNPLAINVNGKAYFAKDIEDAKEYVISYLRKGVRNIDIGLMQINLRWHGKEFDNVAHMLIPESNIDYAGKLLSSLAKSNGGDWHKAVRYYHSSNPYYYRKYSKKIVSTWMASI